YGSGPPPAGAYQGGYQPIPAGGYPQQPPPGAYQGGGYDQPRYGGYTNQAGPQQTSYQQYGVVVQQQPAPQVVLVGGCPACRVGVLEEDYTCLGVLCAILFFPLGILCCLAMRQRRCPNCGAVFD
ncbi:hypothetical protein FSP39_009702, partial [Pinctada imbricata]